MVAHYLLGWAWRPSWLAGTAHSTTSVAVVYAVMLELGFNQTTYGKAILARWDLLLFDDVDWPYVRNDFSAIRLEPRHHRSGTILASGRDGDRQRCDPDRDRKRAIHAAASVAGAGARIKGIGLWRAGRRSRNVADRVGGMLTKGPAKKVTIFINEDTQHHLAALQIEVLAEENEGHPNPCAGERESCRQEGKYGWRLPPHSVANPVLSPPRHRPGRPCAG